MLVTILLGALTAVVNVAFWLLTHLRSLRSLTVAVMVRYLAYRWYH